MNILKNISNLKKTLLFAVLLCTLGMYSQERVKIDGVVVVVGKNIVLDSDIEKFKQEIERQSEGKIQISDCEMLEELMMQKLLSHHAIIDSVIVNADEVEAKVDQTIASFAQQLGSEEKVIEFYGFNDIVDLRSELSQINEEQFLIQRERASIVEEVGVSPDEVRTYFNSLKDEDALPEFGVEIEISQIVIYAQPTEEEIKRVTDKLLKLKAEIEAGGNMNMKAILNSDDPSVASKGPGSGGLFTITRESGFVKEFKEAAFSLDEGQVSEPFKSDFGYHIVRVEKIKGQTLDVRHILIQPDIDSSKLKEAKEILEKLKSEIEAGTILFEDAVLEYSEEDITKNNHGIIINDQSGDSNFELTRMDPTLYQKVANLDGGEMTAPFYDETREGEKMFKIILLKSKTDAHTADYVVDYVKIQALALQKKREEAIEDWAEDKMEDTYIKIGEDYSECTFDKNWKKD